ncbi:hypothetical protein VCR4J2_500099 [Vibrio coralliirubri]|nr:hypothetical protein VCR4J2_500099 [Vibrio coralliirubri]
MILKPCRQLKILPKLSIKSLLLRMSLLTSHINKNKEFGKVLSNTQSIRCP